ncbi:MAG: hypothetical protein ACJAWW_002157 [Sulfurimonas sp.]|jgi:hypothetical protein
MIQKFISRLKSNKRLWFTSIFIISILGIASSTYLLVSTTTRVSNSVYTSQIKDYELRFKNLENLTKNKLSQIALALKQDDRLINSFKDNNVTNLEQIQNKFNSSIKSQEENTLILKLYSTKNKEEVLRNSVISSIQAKNDIFGVEVIYNGIFYIYLLPVSEDDKIIGVIEIRQNIYSLRENFTNLKQEQIFLLDSKMLPLLSIQNKDGIYIPVAKNHLINSKIYDSVTLGYLPELDHLALEEIMKGNYIITKELYLTGVMIRDLNGVNIGLVVMGENINKDSSFVNMAKTMTNQVIMIVLGLIVALLLFLF